MSARRNDFLEVGTEVGGYRILGVVKGGGFGVLYRAIALPRRVNLVRRQLGQTREIVEAGDGILVAVKEFFPLGIAHREEGVVTVNQDVERSIYDQALAKFITESQRLITDFDHPNIVRGIELFADRGTYFFAMEFIRGEGFGDWLAKYVRTEGAYPTEAVLKPTFEQLLDAVGIVHDLDQMHRDIKPDNIMLREDGTPVLIDFGLVGEGLNKARRGTLAAFSAGYSPPEQTGAHGTMMAGRFVDYSKQGRYTDIYALGGVLFRATTGRSPTDNEDRLSAMRAGTMDDIEKRLTALDKHAYTPAFIDGIRHALHLDPTERPQTVADFRRELGWTDSFTHPITQVRTGLKRTLRGFEPELERPTGRHTDATRPASAPPATSPPATSPVATAQATEAVPPATAFAATDQPTQAAPPAPVSSAAVDPGATVAAQPQGVTADPTVGPRPLVPPTLPAPAPPPTARTAFVDPRALAAEAASADADSPAAATQPEATVQGAAQAVETTVPEAFQATAATRAAPPSNVDASEAPTRATPATFAQAATPAWGGAQIAAPPAPPSTFGIATVQGGATAPPAFQPPFVPPAAASGGSSRSGGGANKAVPIGIAAAVAVAVIGGGVALLGGGGGGGGGQTNQQQQVVTPQPQQIVSPPQQPSGPTQAQLQREQEEQRQRDIARQQDEQRQRDIARQQEEQRQRDIARQQDEQRQRDIARQQEEQRQRDIARQQEEQRQRDIARQQEEQRQRDIARQQEEQRQRDIARQTPPPTPGGGGLIVDPGQSLTPAQTAPPPQPPREQLIARLPDPVTTTPAQLPPPAPQVNPTQLETVRNQAVLALSSNGIRQPHAVVKGNVVFVSGIANNEAGKRQAMEAVGRIAAGRTVVEAVQVGGALDTGLVIPNRDSRQAATDCDRLALPADHPERPAAVAGTNYDVIDGPRAVDACQATVRAVHRPRHLAALGMAQLRQRNLQDAFDNLVRAAIQDDATAMLFLGLLFETNALGPVNAPQARDWFEQAAARGNANAMIALASSLRSVQGGPVDLEAARLWLMRGARLGNAQAMTELGLMLRDGPDGSARMQEVVAWFTRAGQLGDAQGLAELGTMYERGLGVAVDAARGTQFHREAASALATAYRAGEWAARRAMDQELAGWPDAVRFEVQRMLQAGGFYRGPINGRITAEIRTAFETWSSNTATR